MKSNILNDIGERHQTDKRGGAEHGHDFLRKYEFFLRPLREEKFTLLELGVFKGASLRTWEEYFPNAEIIGVDCEPAAALHAGGRKSVILGDLNQPGFLETLPDLNPRVIIDDASHTWQDQLLALFVLYPVLMSGGIYIAEDLHTSFPPLAALFNSGQKHSTFEVLLKVAEYMTGNQRPAPIVRDQLLEPLRRLELFDAEIRLVADLTEAITFIERAAILIRK